MITEICEQTDVQFRFVCSCFLSSSFFLRVVVGVVVFVAVLYYALDLTLFNFVSADILRMLFSTHGCSHSFQN